MKWNLSVSSRLVLLKMTRLQGGGVSRQKRKHKMKMRYFPMNKASKLKYLEGITPCSICLEQSVD